MTGRLIGNHVDLIVVWARESMGSYLYFHPVFDASRRSLKWKPLRRRHCIGVHEPERKQKGEGGEYAATINFALASQSHFNSRCEFMQCIMPALVHLHPRRGVR